MSLTMFILYEQSIRFVINDWWLICTALWNIQNKNIDDIVNELLEKL